MNKIEDMEIFDLGNFKGEHEIRIIGTLSSCTQRRHQILDHQLIVDFLNEVEEQDWTLDADDIRHILKLDFDYVRKQHIIEPKNTADLQRKFIKTKLSIGNGKND